MKWMRPTVTDFFLIGLLILTKSTTESVPPLPPGSTTLGSPQSTTTASTSQSSTTTTTNTIQIEPDTATKQINATLADDYTEQSQEVAAVAIGDDEPSVESVNEVWAKIRHLHQKVRLKENDQVDENHDTQSQEWDYIEDSTGQPPSTPIDNKNKPLQMKTSPRVNPITNNTLNKARSNRIKANNLTATAKPFRILASGSRKSKLLAAANAGSSTNSLGSQTRLPFLPSESKNQIQETTPPTTTTTTTQKGQVILPINPPRPVVPRSFLSPESTTGAPKLENKFSAIGGSNEARLQSAESLSDSTTLVSEPADILELYDSSDPDSGSDVNSLDDPSTYDSMNKPNLDIMTKFLRIVESQSLLGDNCTAGTDFNLGEGVVDRYAQERFRLEAEVAVNRANWLTRLWKYADKAVLDSEYLLHVNLYSMIEMDEDIFAAGNCYDK